MKPEDKPKEEPEAVEDENHAETAMLLEELAKKGPVVLMAKNPDKLLNRQGKPVKLNEDGGQAKPSKSSTSTSTNSLRKNGRIRGVDGTSEKYIRERDSSN
jgi:hypothetical protein